MKHRLHIIGVPHAINNTDYCACAYTQKVRLFCRMMTERGHHVVLYGHPDDDAVCSEHVNVIDRETFDRVYGGHDWKDKLFKFDLHDEVYQTFYRNVKAELWRHRNDQTGEQCTEFLLPFWNAAGFVGLQEAHKDMIVVEPGIGYSSGHYAPYKIFESYALMHAYYGLDGGIIGHMSWYDAVIPNYFDPDEYTYSEDKGDYLLFLGRIGEAKGIHIAIRTAIESNTPLHIYGQGMADYQEMWERENGGPNPLLHWKGYADIETRRQAFARAKALILPGKYLEPFGGTQVQALLSGTPLITSDWGAYTEVNTEGVGFRCRMLREFVDAVAGVESISPEICRQRGERYTMANIAPLYEQHFQRLHDAHTQPNPWYCRTSESGYNWQAMVDEETPFAKRLAEWVANTIKPKTLADIGCGPGHFVGALREHDVDAHGFDAEATGEHITTTDITKDNIDITFDAVLCLEVLEHIPPDGEARSLRAIFNAIKPGGYLIFSAAAPGQGGNGHINLKPKDHWITSLCNLGMTWDYSLTQNAIHHAESGYHMGWFIQNAFILRKNSP